MRRVLGVGVAVADVRYVLDREGVVHVDTMAKRSYCHSWCASMLWAAGGGVNRPSTGLTLGTTPTCIVCIVLSSTKENDDEST